MLADNARTINNNKVRKTVANFRQSRGSDFFNETFKSRKGNWYPVEGKWKASGGVLRHADAGASRHPSVAFKGMYEDFNFTARLRRSTATTARCRNFATRLQVSGKPYPKFDSNGFWNTAYLIQYTNDGLFSVWRVIDFVATAVQDWTSTSAINKAEGNSSGEWNNLEVTVEGTTIFFFINDQKVWSGSDPQLAKVDPDALFVGVGYAPCDTSPGADELEIDETSAFSL